tara:strand:+ start:464 stop:604 length:141 start_codon:yes stop_codon:yes gene_type:complete
METMKVKPWGKDQGDFVVINKDDFDPEKHEEFEKEPVRRGRKPKAE